MTRTQPYLAPCRQRGEQDSLGRSPRSCAGFRKTIRIALVCLFGALCPSTSSPAQTSTEKLAAAPAKVGVVVERVEQGEEAEVAGVQVGDQIVDWAGGGNSGTIEAPVDWDEMLTEEARRGTVTLRGWRGDKNVVWSLALRTWGLMVEPTLPERLTKAYQSCRVLQKAEKSREAGLCWESVASNIRPGDPHWLARLIFNQIAKSFTKQQRWAEADRAYQRAVDQSRAVGQESVAQALEEWSLARRDRGDLGAAIEYCEQALKIRQEQIGRAHV